MVLFRVYQTNCCILRTLRTLRYFGIEQLSLYTLGILPILVIGCSCIRTPSLTITIRERYTLSVRIGYTWLYTGFRCR